MGRVALLATAVALLAAMSPAGVAAQGDPCSFVRQATERVVGTNDADAFKSKFANLLNEVAGWFSKPYMRALGDDEKGIYFTRQTGFTFVLD